MQGRPLALVIGATGAFGGETAERLQAARAAQEQGRAQPSLQLVDVAADGRLGELPELGGGGEAAGGEHRVQALEEVPFGRIGHASLYG